MWSSTQIGKTKKVFKKMLESLTYNLIGNNKMFFFFKQINV